MTEDLKTQAEKELEELEAEEEEIKRAREAVAKAREDLLSVGISSEELSPEEAVEKAERVRAARTRQAQVLSRGRTLDGLDSALSHVPPGHHGEFVRENDGDINRKRALGFEVFRDEEASDSSPHGTGDNRVRVGDVILMTIPEEEYAALESVRAERRAKKRNAAKKTKAQIEASGLKTFGGN